MKKLILATLMAGLVPMMTLAQGTVLFNSGTAQQIVVQQSLTPVGAGYIAALYGGAANAAEGTLTQLGGTTAVFSGSGFISGGVRTNAAIAGGAQGSFQVRAWTSAQGSTWEVASVNPTAIAGKTVVFQINATGNPVGSPPTAPVGLGSGWNTPLIVTPVPEPSTLALAGLGIASLLVIRRRK